MVRALHILQNTISVHQHLLLLIAGASQVKISILVKLVPSIGLVDSLSPNNLRQLLQRPSLLSTGVNAHNFVRDVDFASLD